MNSTAAQTFYSRFQRVLCHIDEHLDDDLSVEGLSEIAAFSKYHFHRQFTELFGIGVYRYVQLARLKRASYRLAFRPDMPIIEIALESSYDGPEAFSRAFKERVGQTPSEFRRKPDWIAWRSAYRVFSETRMMHMGQDLRDHTVRIIDVGDTPVAVLEHRGDPALVFESVRRFIAWRREAKLPPKISATFNILYDNPLDTPPEAFRLDLCAATERELMPNGAGIVAKVIPGGRCAVLRHVGSDDGLGNALRHLYVDWLPQSGGELRDFPPYLQRVRFFPDVAEHQAVTDIFLPLR